MQQNFPFSFVRFSNFPYFSSVFHIFCKRLSRPFNLEKRFGTVVPNLFPVQKFSIISTSSMPMRF